MNQKLKHVLLTRVEGRNDNLAVALEKNNISSSEMPMFEIAVTAEAGKISELKQQLTGVIEPDIDTGYKLDATFDFAFFSSANAVLAAGNFCKQYNVKWPADLPCLGMGSATYAAIDRQGWAPMLPDDPSGQKDSLTSEEMLDTSWALEVGGKRILLVNGEKGRGLLAERLRQSGAAVEVVTLYRRERVEYSAADCSERLRQLKQDVESSAAVFASGNTMTNFCELVNEGFIEESLLHNLRCLVPSLRVAIEAKERGFKKIVVAEGATDNAFLQKLLELAR